MRHPADFVRTALVPAFAVAGACALAVGLAGPAAAQQIAYEPFDLTLEAPRLPVTGGERLVRLDSPAPLMPAAAAAPARLTGREAAYGPFRVIDATHAALVDVTGPRSPAQFQAMLRDHPGIAQIEMVECPGTEDDIANLQLGRMIRARGIATHVPANGSVRSGGVELFLAGARRTADPGAEFAVHSWLDDTGLEPSDYASSAPENRRYVTYYEQMGMSPIEAEAFYAMTNSVPFASARWFGAGVMSLWVSLDSPAGVALAAASDPTPVDGRS
ncbi:alpha/beta hydrolase [Novosphingobium sp. 1949]|uniref:Alpha/beta hydrolase n=1 Tax=Novosphingobium organovorum TaxID=2930092 RepID=A0ABT0BE73_9SPHN|nr:alpha/beta hydrolase [Novosphingobium organovorum]MCJ2183091.1 alpha/beta hydrolase [Novosphingobium organovorum]